MQPGNLSDDREKAIGFPVVIINYDGIRGRIERLLPLDQVITITPKQAQEVCAMATNGIIKYGH